MKKLLIKFTYRLRNKEEFNEIINKFILKGFEVVELEYEKNSFNINSIIEKIHREGLNFDENNQIVIISNVKDILYLWHRIYNEIGSFVFFIDKYNYNILKEDEKSILQLLSSMKLVSREEKLLNKIYINIDFNNFQNITEEILENNTYENFNLIENFDYIKSNKSSLIAKTYFYCEEKFINFTNSLIVKDIILEKIDSMIDNKDIYIKKWFFKFWFCYILRNYPISESRKILMNTFENYKSENNSKEEIKKLKEDIVNSKFTTFIEKIDIISIMIFLEIKTEEMSKEIFELIKNDNNENIEKYPSILINLLSYGSFIKFTGHETIEEEYNKVFDRVIEKIEKKIEIQKKEYYNNSKKIALIVDSLHNDIYSSTKFIKNLVNNIVKYKSEYEVRIFVEDSFKLSEEENQVLFSKLTEQPPSFYFGKEHKKIFNENIKIEYFNKNIGLNNKIKNIINGINDFNPEIILSTSLISFVINQLNKNYPTFYISLGKINTRNKFDAYISRALRNEIEILQKKNISSENIFNLKMVFEFEESKENYERKEFGIEKNDIVFVTVGIRLQNEMKQEFIDKIANVLLNNKNIKWYIIGIEKMEYIQKKYFKLIEKQIFFKKIETKLGSFYKLCDVYLNPDREGGGYSIAEAIVNKVPVLSLKSSKSAVNYMGIENAFENYKEYFENLTENLIKKEKLKILNENQIKNMDKYSTKDIIKYLFEYIEIAKIIFEKRKNIIKN